MVTMRRGTWSNKLFVGTPIMSEGNILYAPRT